MGKREIQQNDEHQPTFTWYSRKPGTGMVGLYCTCGWVWGMGNQLAASRAWDDHFLAGSKIEKVRYWSNGDASG